MFFFTQSLVAFHFDIFNMFIYVYECMHVYDEGFSKWNKRAIYKKQKVIAFSCRWIVNTSLVVK